MIRIGYIAILFYIIIGMYIFIPIFEIKAILFMTSIIGLLLFMVYIFKNLEFNEVDKD